MQATNLLMIGVFPGPAKSVASKAPASREYQTLEEYEAAKSSGSKAAPVVPNAWGSKPTAASKPAVAEPLASARRQVHDWLTISALPVIMKYMIRDFVVQSLCLHYQNRQMNNPSPHS